MYLDILIVSGMSGAGKSKCLKVLEDIGYYCIDNIMPQLIHNVVEVCVKNQESAAFDRLAVSVDVRGGIFFGGIYSALEQLKNSGYKYRLLFLDAQDNILVNRYKETRREHPLAVGGRIGGGIQKEREMMSQLRAKADILIDTSYLTESDLKQKIYDVVPTRYIDKTDVTVTTFGFKRGTPMDCDMLFDVRFLPNPFHVPELRPLNGTNKEVAAYVYQDPKAESFVTRIADMVMDILPEYRQNVKRVLVIGIGCTGGKHRSVATACHLAQLLKDKGLNVALVHRELFME